jgi:hypothetical protein
MFQEMQSDNGRTQGKIEITTAEVIGRMIKGTKETQNLEQTSYKK